MKQQTLLPILVSVLALLFLDPFHILMPDGMEMVLLGVLMLSTISYGLFIYNERPQDEREVSIRAFVDHTTYLVGMVLLVVAIAYRLIVDGHVYPEIILILVIMIISKTIAHSYACKNR
ncbi:MAG: hypothetical protein H6779_02905 [Candidatus Nomurabacteria bacterium]|nr:hypothetical protein [Candidatus Nomurabacteria bacterium]USN87339.1 MAG: hypothetical protein H6779_02905 [Candidatus Nomurabacteria bacterium]